VLVLRAHLEVRKNRQEQEDVIDRQGFFDQVAGKEFQCLAVGQRGTVQSAKVPPQSGVEGQCQAHPRQRPAGRFPHRHPVHLVAAKHKQVQRKHRHDKRDEAEPDRHGGNVFQLVHVRSLVGEANGAILSVLRKLFYAHGDHLRAGAVSN
jgi:hypothetical protein